MLAWKLAQPLWTSCSQRIGSSFKKAQNLVCSRLTTSNARTRSRRTSPGEEIKIRSVFIRRPPSVLLSYSFRSAVVNVPISGSKEKPDACLFAEPEGHCLTMRRIRKCDLRQFFKTPLHRKVRPRGRAVKGRTSTFFFAPKRSCILHPTNPIVQSNRTAIR